MMTPDMRDTLKKLVVKHEGFENFPYADTLGNITIGIGYNLSSRGLPDSWINKQYEDDVAYFYNALTEDFTWFRSLDSVRQIVLINMCFMGYKSFKSFKYMIAALERKDYETAAKEMLDSKWARQVKGRAHELAEIMLKGEL